MMVEVEGRGSPTAEVLGLLGLPAAIGELTARRWDVVVVGAGHNGLTCAAYLARAGKRVLVLEARPRVGGACTLEEVWPGFRVSPCAYLVGLLHPLVIEELDLPGHGFRWFPADAGLFVPFDDGASIQLWDDDARCEEEIRRLAPGDLDGWRALIDVKRRLRDAIRPPGDGDLWIGPAPTRARSRSGSGGTTRRGDSSSSGRWSSSSSTTSATSGCRWRYLGQGVIGTNASPHDPGTASIHFHHASGRLGGMPGTWGYVLGGMGMVSFLLCDVAREAGAVVATGVPVARIVPGPGGGARGGRADRRPVRRLQRRPPDHACACSATTPTRPGASGSRRSR